jgi:TolB protein
MPRVTARRNSRRLVTEFEKEEVFSVAVGMNPTLKQLLLVLLASALILFGLFLVQAQNASSRVGLDADEPHLRNLKQLTFGGQNAEAYFSSDGSKLIFQSTRSPYQCDQIFSMNVDGSNVKLLNSGKGRTTCGFFFPDGKRITYASTHLTSDTCPPAPDRSQGYVWPIYPAYEIFSANIDGTGMKRLTKIPGYDAEGTISPDGKKIVFTSIRTGDLDIYTMSTDGSGVKRLTSEKGYDGGPFFSWDGKTIVYRAYHPKTKDEVKEYEGLLKQNLIKPTRAEIFMMSADGSNKRQITNNGAANWAPFLHPNNRQIIFSSNLHDPERKSFSLYTINVDGTGLERITYGARFDSFPMLSRDGKKLVFASTRNGTEPREFNIFIADWTR